MLVPLLLLLSSVSTVLTFDDLMLVQVLYRHGDRTPIAPYPNDPYKNPDQWPVGFGELTPIGTQMQYGLGKYFRQRYKGFLSDTFRASDIYVRSTDVDRTLMSAQANLAGMYPTKGIQIWNKDLHWQPIPVHTVPYPEDTLMGTYTCPRADAIVKDITETDPKLKALDKENEWLYKYIANHTGLGGCNISTLVSVYDTLNIEKRYNKTLPAWTDAVFPGKMQKTFNIAFTIATWNDELKRLRSGTLIQKIIDNVYDRLANKTQYLFHMFSGHDSTISALLNSLGLFDNPGMPPYTATVFIELFNNKGSPALKFTYKNESGEHVLTVPGCQKLCPIAEFDRITAKLRPLDIKAECLVKNVTLHTITLITNVICSLLVLILVISLLVAVWTRAKKSSQKNYRYFSVEREF